MRNGSGPLSVERTGRIVEASKPVLSCDVAKGEILVRPSRRSRGADLFAGPPHRQSCSLLPTLAAALAQAAVYKYQYEHSCKYS